MNWLAHHEPTPWGAVAFVIAVGLGAIGLMIYMWWRDMRWWKEYDRERSRR